MLKWLTGKQPVPVLGNQEQLVSVEDVSNIRRQLQESTDSDRVNFNPSGVNEHPLIARRGEELSPEDQSRRREPDKWRGHDD